MTTIQLALIGIDLVAAAILTFALYYRRHHRRDLLVAFLGVNVGVLAVTSVLAGASKPQQIIDNIGALKNTDFSDEELKAIDEISMQ